ncbi:MAG: hypothetical protein Q7U51_14220, partial [Methanoregula sp.]|nr:hypothetical protein [Methanoregula sp.]
MINLTQINLARPLQTTTFSAFVPEIDDGPHLTGSGSVNQMRGRGRTTIRPNEVVLFKIPIGMQDLFLHTLHIELFYVFDPYDR